MTAALVVFAALLATAAGTAVTLAIKYGNERAVSARLAAQLSRSGERVGDLESRLQLVLAAADETKARLDAVIALKAAEIERLEGLIDEVDDPTAVRERLAGSGLLGDPQEGTRAADRSTAAAGLPPRPAPGVGAPGSGTGRR